MEYLNVVFRWKQLNAEVAEKVATWLYFTLNSFNTSVRDSSVAFTQLFHRHTFSSSLLMYHVICHYPSSFISAASLSRCVVERVISAKLHRRHRLSPRTKKQDDGEIFTESRRGKKAAKHWKRTCCSLRGKKKARLSSCLPLFHISAVRQQLFSSSTAAGNGLHVSVVRLCPVIVPAKFVKASFYVHLKPIIQSDGI